MSELLRVAIGWRLSGRPFPGQPSHISSGFNPECKYGEQDSAACLFRAASRPLFQPRSLAFLALATIRMKMLSKKPTCHGCFLAISYLDIQNCA